MISVIPIISKVNVQSTNDEQNVIESFISLILDNDFNYSNNFQS